MKEITSTITKSLTVLGENGKGYTKEATSFLGTAMMPSWTSESGIRTTSVTARASRSRRMRAETFTPHSRQSMKRNNPFFGR